MSSDLCSRTWTYRQSSGGALIKLSTTAYESGVYHSLLVEGKGARVCVEMDEQAIDALATAVASIEKNPDLRDEFAINQSLSLICESPAFVLRNCEVSYKFPAFEHLNALWDRLSEAAMVAQIFG